MAQFARLFEPGKIGKMELKNRIVMEPLGRQYATEPGGYTTPRQIALFEARARGGAALIHVTVRAFAKDPPYGPGNLNLCDDEHIYSVQRFTQALKAHGTKLSAFISHPGRSLSQALPDAPVVAPSPVRHPLTGAVPKELSKAEIREIIDAYAEAAQRAKSAGFDAVTIMCGHGYLVSQFLSLRTNKRTDEYGGSLANRTRFGCEVIRRTREKVGPDFPIIVRMNGDDYVDGGVRIEDAVQHAPFFVEAGADALDISAGTREGRHWFYPGHLQPYGTFIHLAAAIKKVVNVPVCAVSKITPILAERILQEGSADFIGMCRSLIADPDLPNKVREGRLEDIRPCIYCNQCLYLNKPYVNKEPRFLCSVNPACGWELEYEREMRPVGSAKKVMVIGGGLAGMEAARTLAERGHECSLYEKSGKLGGQWNIVSNYHPELSDLTRYLSKGLEKARVKVFLNKEVIPNMVEKAKPDAVVVATGAQPVTLDAPGASGENVVSAIDVLMGKVGVGEEAVIIGGRRIGLDTALLLTQRNKKVSVVSRGKIARGLESPLMLAYKENLIKYGVYMYPDSVLESITKNGVNVVCDGEIIFLKADTIVLAVGYKSANKLAEQLRGLMSEVYTVGDCIEPRNALAAINEGSVVGREI